MTNMGMPTSMTVPSSMSHDDNMQGHMEEGMVCVVHTCMAFISFLRFSSSSPATTTPLLLDYKTLASFLT